MSYQAGDTYPWSVEIRDGSGELTDPDSLIVSVREADGTVTDYAYGVDALVVRDDVGEYHADVPLTAPGMWVIQGATTNEQQTEAVQVWVSETPVLTVTFCTVADVATRLGRTLTENEASSAAMFCELVTGEIAAAVDKGADWPATLEDIPSPLRSIALDVVSRLLLNPTGLSSTSETLGAYSYTQRFGADTMPQAVGSGVSLTAAEKRRVRRAVFGASVDSIEVASIFESELLLP